ncbi:hypothetical protein [Corynebacterium xerosis]|uniref:hypothetical protein n=1 Tax=Corynebacterium xerosis TaxID=1725 RepID=UPI0038794DFD
MPVVEGIISGSVSGLIVALALGVISRAREENFTFTSVGDGRAVLDYRGSRTIVIGGSFAFERGVVLATADGFRGGTSGIIVKPRTQNVFLVGDLPPGEGFDFTYRVVPWWKARRLERSGELYQWECDVMEFLSSESLPPKRWKLASRVLIPLS